VAHFYDYGLASGWWFYFQLKYASETAEWRADFINELALLIDEEGEPNIVKNDKKQERVSLRKVRSKGY